MNTWKRKRLLLLLPQAKLLASEFFMIINSRCLAGPENCITVSHCIQLQLLSQYEGVSTRLKKRIQFKNLFISSPNYFLAVRSKVSGWSGNGLNTTVLKLEFQFIMRRNFLMIREELGLSLKGVSLC